MTEVLIERASLGTIERALGRILDVTAYTKDAVHELHGRVHEVQGRVVNVQSRQEQLAAELSELADDFAEFVRADAAQKALQLAETRIVKVRQELETRFGYYAEIRRRATGLLQALDAGLVTHETVQHTTEDLMMAAPGYWLAPALVSLAAWLRGDRETAQRAVAETVRRDDYKASLYFSLVLHRCGRSAASALWLDRFFGHQDPAELNREFVVLLDVVANGFFGSEAREVTTQQVARWLTELAQQAGFVEEQEARWSKALAALRPAISGGRYPTLSRCSPDWSTMAEALSYAHLNGIVAAYFQKMFTGDIVPLPRLAAELDRMLRSLVTHFDAEELPLRTSERELQLIIDCDGDRAAALQRFEAEQEAFEERVSFTALLTNAAMHPEISKASLATQRYAVALSRDWIVSAFERLIRNGRAKVLRAFALRIDGWVGSTEDGSNERQLLASHEEHLRSAEAAEAAKLGLPPVAIAAPILGVVLVIYGVASLFSIVALIAGAGAILYWFFERRRLAKRLEEVAERFRRVREEQARTLKAALQEVIRYRAELAQFDGHYVHARELLTAISPEQSAYAFADDAPTPA